MQELDLPQAKSIPLKDSPTVPLYDQYLKFISVQDEVLKFLFIGEPIFFAYFSFLFSAFHTFIETHQLFEDGKMDNNIVTTVRGLLLIQKSSFILA